MDIMRIVKNVLPAVVVLVVGLFGINFIYNSYMKDGSTAVITLEPAAGEEGAAHAEAAIAPAPEAAVTDAVAPAVEGTAEAATDCVNKVEGAVTEGAEATAEAATNCVDAAPAAAVEGAVDAAAEGKLEAVQPMETAPAPAPGH